MRSSLAFLSVAVISCGSQPADELADSDVGAADTAATDTQPTDVDAGTCQILIVEPGPAYTPHPSWGTTHAIADGDTIFAAIPAQSDAVDSHFVTAYVDGIESDRQLVGGQLSLVDASDGRALVRFHGESGEGFASVGVDGEVVNLSDQHRVRPGSGFGMWEPDAAPIRVFDGAHLVGIEGGGDRVTYFDPPLQTSLRVPVLGGSFVEAELTGDGIIASVRSDAEPTGEYSVHRWSRDDDWELVANGLATLPRIDAGASGVFWTQVDGVYRSEFDGIAERIFEGDCGAVDAEGQFAVFACFGNAGEFPGETDAWNQIRGTLWLYDGTDVQSVPTSGGFLFAPRVSETAVAWVEYAATGYREFCQMDAMGTVFVAGVEELEPVEAGAIGLGCGCCAFAGEPLQFSLSTNYAVWNYANPGESLGTPGWNSARYDLVPCEP